MLLPGWVGGGRLDGRLREKERPTRTGTDEHRLALEGKGQVSRRGWRLLRAAPTLLWPHLGPETVRQSRAMNSSLYGDSAGRVQDLNSASWKE